MRRAGRSGRVIAGRGQGPVARPGAGVLPSGARGALRGQAALVQGLTLDEHGSAVCVAVHAVGLARVIPVLAHGLQDVVGATANLASPSPAVNNNKLIDPLDKLANILQFTYSQIS